MSKNCCVKWAMKFSIIWRNLWNFELYSNKFLKTNSERSLCRVPSHDTRQKVTMPSVLSGHLATCGFAKCPDLALGKEALSLPSARSRHSAKRLLVCRVPDLGTRHTKLLPSALTGHSAKWPLPSAPTGHSAKWSFWIYFQKFVWIQFKFSQISSNHGKFHCPFHTTILTHVLPKLFPIISITIISYISIYMN